MYLGSNHEQPVGYCITDFVCLQEGVAFIDWRNLRNGTKRTSLNFFFCFHAKLVFLGCFQVKIKIFIALGKSSSL